MERTIRIMQRRPDRGLAANALGAPESSVETMNAITFFLSGDSG
jgi:hypothetical protein